MAFELRDPNYIASKAGYVIAKVKLGEGGAYYATKNGKRLALEFFKTDDEQAAALKACKAACERDYTAGNPA